MSQACLRDGGETRVCSSVSPKRLNQTPVFSKPPRTSVCLYPPECGTPDPAALGQSRRALTAIVTAELAEGLTTSPWKLHVFTSEMSEGRARPSPGSYYCGDETAMLTYLCVQVGS